jgi:hypothetical protein
MRPFETNTAGASTTKQVVLYDPHAARVVNGGYGAAKLGLIRCIFSKLPGKLRLKLAAAGVYWDC